MIDKQEKLEIKLDPWSSAVDTAEMEKLALIEFSPFGCQVLIIWHFEKN